MLTAFWNVFVIALTLASILGCWWLLHWTKGISDRKDGKTGSTGHVWDEDLVELNSPLPRWWLHLFNLTIIFSLVYLVLYPGLGNVQGVLGWTQVQQYDEQMDSSSAALDAVFARYADMTPQQLSTDPDALDTGRRLFGNHCAMCHGSDGRGATGFPNLADADWLYGGTFDTILASIEQGRIGVMPPMSAVLGHDGVRQVVEYVKQLSGQNADPGLAQAGKAHYDMLCVACHGPDGTGIQALGAPNLADDTWLYGGTREAINTSIAQGRSGNMPAHRDLLSEQRRRVVAAYVLSLSAER